jgi:glycosyltransferase involved in cell wall biosynthesis
MSTPPLKVLHLIDSLPVGGAETLLIDSLNELSATFPDDEHHLATVYQGGPLLERFVNARTRYLNLGFSASRALPAIWRLRRFIQDRGIQIVHAHLYKASMLARPGLPGGVKLVSTYHTTFHDPASIDFSWKRLLIDRLSYRRCYRFIFVADSVEQDHRKRLPLTDNTVVLTNFTSKEFTPRYRHRPGDDLRLVSVGNFRLQKNHALAIEAIAAVADRRVSLDIYGGGGHLEQALLKQIADTGVPVRLLKHVKITSELLAGYDAFLMTSLHEGMSIALLEAIRTGMPSILNDIPSFRETARDAGLYFARDSAASLADVLRRCLHDRSLLARAADRALVYADEFTIDRYIQSLRALYGRMVADPAPMPVSRYSTTP